MPTDMELSDLGLYGIGSGEVFGLILCLFLGLISFKMKSFPFMVVSALGLMVVGFQIVSVTGEPIVFLLLLALAAAELSFGSKFKGW